VIQTGAERLAIRTPEGVEFSLLLAGPGVRLLALALDLMCVVAISDFVSTVLRVLLVFSADLAGAVLTIAYFTISLFYWMGAEWFWRGQTVGKRVLKLRVMDAGGGRLEPDQIILRNVLRFVDMLPAFYLLGAAASLCNRRLQRLGDLAAGTVVVRLEELTAPDLGQLLGSKFNSMLGHRRPAALLRQKTPPELAAAALDAVVRRDQLYPEARVKVFAELAGRFRALVAFPAEDVEFIADEQYVRNAVEIVFRPAGAAAVNAPTLR
jgi:uncharacterized RDD family membrane protein YckC